VRLPLILACRQNSTQKEEGYEHTEPLLRDEYALIRLQVSTLHGTNPLFASQHSTNHPSVALLDYSARSLPSHGPLDLEHLRSAKE
jgi:hypothetical protein